MTLGKRRDWLIAPLSSKSKLSTRKNILTAKLSRDSCRNLGMGWEDLHLPLRSARD